MSQFHEAKIGRPQLIAGYILSVLPSLAVLFSGLLKFTAEPEILVLLEKLGMADQAVAIGVVEIVCVLVYWVPRTVNLGFFLFCAYSGGIVVAELILGDFPLPGLAIGAMLVVGTLLRKPSLSGWKA
jgi:hypothetical protein